MLESLGIRLKKRRQEFGWTQKILSSQCGISNRFISDLERGRRTPSTNAALRIALALRISLDYLIKGDRRRNERRGLR